MKHGISVAMLAGLLLTGCASGDQTFSCNNTGTVLCNRLDEVNDKVDQGTLPNKAVSSMTRSLRSAWVPTRQWMKSSDTQAVPLRYAETTLHVWFAPFVDKDDVYHHPAEMDVVIKPGHWVGNPVRTDTLLEDE